MWNQKHIAMGISGLGLQQGDLEEDLEGGLEEKVNEDEGKNQVCKVKVCKFEVFKAMETG